jgi:hypothetical protein
LRRGLAAVTSAGLVYDLVVLPHRIPAALGAAAALPGLTFVLDHLGKPPIASGQLGAWDREVRVFVVDSYVDPGNDRQLIEELTGQDRRTFSAGWERPGQGPRHRHLVTSPSFTTGSGQDTGAAEPARPDRSRHRPHYSAHTAMTTGRDAPA